MLSNDEFLFSAYLPNSSASSQVSKSINVHQICLKIGQEYKDHKTLSEAKVHGFILCEWHTEIPISRSRIQYEYLGKSQPVHRWEIQYCWDSLINSWKNSRVTYFYNSTTIYKRYQFHDIWILIKSKWCLKCVYDAEAPVKDIDPPTAP